MSRRLPPLVLLLALSGCSLFGGEEPIPVGTFEAEVSGDYNATASGTVSFVEYVEASDLDGAFAHLAFGIEAAESGAGPDGEPTGEVERVRLRLYDPSGFGERNTARGLPTGRFGVGTNPVGGSPGVGTARQRTGSGAIDMAGSSDLLLSSGRLDMRETEEGVQGEVESRYVIVDFTGIVVYEGPIRLRFHLPAAQ